MPPYRFLLMREHGEAADPAAFVSDEPDWNASDTFRGGRPLLPNPRYQRARDCRSHRAHLRGGLDRGRGARLDEGWTIELGHQRLRPERATAEARPELLELRARPRPPLPAERIVQQDKVAANAGQNDGVLAEVDADRLALGRPPSRVRPFAETDPYHHGPSQRYRAAGLARARFTSLIP